MCFVKPQIHEMYSHIGKRILHMVDAGTFAIKIKSIEHLSKDNDEERHLTVYK